MSAFHQMKMAAYWSQQAARRLITSVCGQNGRHQKFSFRKNGQFQTHMFKFYQQCVTSNLGTQGRLQITKSRLTLSLAIGTTGFCYGFLGLSFGKPEKKDSDPLVQVFQEAKEAQIRQDFTSAEIKYHDALKVAEEMLKRKKITQKTYIYAKTAIYDSLADLALASGMLENAEHLYKETMKGCLQQGLTKDSNAIVELSIKLSSIYAMQNRTEEAEQGLQYCIQVQDSKLTKDVAAASNSPTVSKTTAVLDVETEEYEKQDTEALLGMALETYGRFLMGQRRLDEAVVALHRACAIAESVLGENSGQYLVLLNDLATAHILQKHFDTALTVLNKAITLGSKNNSRELPALYCNLGAVFLRTSKIDAAAEACTEGQKLANEKHDSLALGMAKNCLKKIEQVRKTSQ